MSEFDKELNRSLNRVYMIVMMQGIAISLIGVAVILLELRVSKQSAPTISSVSKQTR